MVVPARGKVYNSILETIGATPIVRLNKFAAHHQLNIELMAKLECFNPLCSLKDRIALAMIEDLEEKGLLHPHSIIIEPTSGNTGIGLAFVAAAKGYKLILTMPESMSMERRKLLEFLGAELVLTPKGEGMKAAIDKAYELVNEIPDAIMPQQFENSANPEIHRKTTAEEIWHDMQGKLDVFIAGVGTGGSITGIGQVLKQYNPKLKIIAVEPENSAVLSGGTPGSHRLQGIGAGFVPDVLDERIIDDIITVSDEESLITARFVAKCEGIPLGMSSGAVLAASIKYAKNHGSASETCLTLCASSAERYISTALFERL